MAIYFVGTCFDSFVRGPVSGATDSATHVFINGTNDAYADASLADPATGQLGGFASVWTHVVCGIPSSSTPYYAGTEFLRWFNSLGQKVMRALGHGGGFTIQWWDGLAWQTVGSTSVTGMGSGTIDVQCHISADEGRVAWYWGQQLMGEVDGVNNSAMVDLAMLRVARYRSYNSTGNFSQCIISDFSTIGHALRRKAATADATHTAWDGTFADIDDAALNDADAITTSTSGAKETFTGAALSATPTGSVVKAVAVAARLRNDGSGSDPQKARALLRIDGVDYVGPDMSLGTGYGARVTVWENNPATGQPWGETITAANSAEFGLEARP